MSEKTRVAATLILVNDDGRVFWARRTKKALFGAFHVFPGGALDDTDPTPEAAAVRETFEEARLTVNPETLLPAGRYLTPPFSPVRFDTHFFIARAPRGQDFVVADAELEAGEWVSPEDALARWRADQAILAAPTKLVFDTLVRTPGDRATDAWLRDAARALAAVSPDVGDWARRIELRPGIFVFPVRTPTLPPATHTNVVIIGDGPELVAIDPASPYPEERSALDKVIDALAAEGRKLKAILLTHRHHDHVSGADHLSERTGAPILAHREVQAALRGIVNVTGTLEDGDVIELPAGSWPGARARRVRAVLTPGHARGHLAFYEESSRTVAAGDLVAGIGFIVVDPPEGDMSVYLRSLERLRDLGATLLYPSHGPPIGDPAGKAQEYVGHRLAREAKVLAAWESGARTMEQILPHAYADTPPQMHPLAARSALAHLLRLQELGKVPAGTFSVND